VARVMKAIKYNKRKFLMVLLPALVVALALLVSRSSVAQSGDEQWNRTFGGSGWDVGFSVAQTSDGGYIVAGYTRSYGAGGNDVWLIKTNSEGNRQWSRTFGGSDWDGAYCVAQTSDGGYIVAGYTRSYDAGADDAWLIKTDSEGNEQWNRVFDGSGWDGAYSVEQTTDGGYILTGWRGSYIGRHQNDIWLIKTDSEGNEQWNRVFGGLLLDVGRCVRQTSDGGYIVIGKTWSYGAGCYDVWLIKTDSEGNKQWNRTFGGSEWDVGNCVAQTSDGGYIIAGRTTSYGAGAGDAWLIKTDSEGDEQWNQTFGGSGYDVGYCVTQTSDGGYIIAGEARSYADSRGDAWLIKTDSEGDEQWSQTFGGLGYYDVSYSVDQTSDGGYIVTGWTRSYGAGRDSVWLIKVGVNPADSTTGDKWYKTFNGFD